jgi:tetratricopeptide (TPR) repeat protein
MGAPYERGLLLFRQERWRQAAEEFRAELAALPQSVSAHAMLALALVNEKQIEPAFAAAAEAIRLAPQYAFAHYAMAHVLLRRPSRQRRWWPRLRLSFWLMIDAEDAHQRMSASKAAVLEAIRLDPSAPDYFELLAVLEAGLGRWKPALQAAERGLAINPSHLGCANQRVHILNHLGRSDDAREQVDRTLMLDPEYATTHRRRGWLLLQHGQVDEARRHFEDALRLNPNDADAKKGLTNARAARFAPIRWFTQFGLWTNLAVNRPMLVIICILAGLSFGIYRDALHVNRWIAGALMLAQTAVLILAWWLVTSMMKRHRSLRAGRAKMQTENARPSVFG